MNAESPECSLLREQWRELMQRDLSVAALQGFYARYKYLVMSRSLAGYREIGALLAAADKNNLAATAESFFTSMMHALATPPTRGGNVNALQHMSGYLKRQLSAEEKRTLGECIERYARGEAELSDPIALLQTYLQRFPNAYIEQQVFLRLPL